MNGCALPSQAAPATGSAVNGNTKKEKSPELGAGDGAMGNKRKKALEEASGQPNKRATPASAVQQKVNVWKDAF